MRRRTRFLAGLIALVAMVASLTETAIASACLPMEAMQAGTMASMADVSDMSHMGGAPCDECVPADHHDRQNHDDAPDCPFSLAGAGNGCVPTALMAVVTAELPAPEARTTIHPSSEIGHPLLRVVAVFHPPRA